MKNRTILSKSIKIIFIIFIILIKAFFTNECFAGSEWKNYIGEEEKLKELGLGEGLDIAKDLCNATCTSAKEAEQLMSLIKAFRTENEKTGSNLAGDKWIWKINEYGEDLPYDADTTISTALAIAYGNAQTRLESKEKPQEVPSEDGNEKNWTEIEPEEISNNGEFSTAQKYYDLLLNSTLNPSPYDTKENLNKFVELLCALKDSSTFQNASTSTDNRNLENTLRNIYNDNQLLEKLDEDTLNLLTDSVDVTVDDNGEKVIHIYKQPTNVSDNSDVLNGDGIDKIIEGAENFTSEGANDRIDSKNMQSTFRFIYNIFFQIGIGLSVIIGLVLGIKFILSGIEEKAEVKKMLGVYVIACIVIFGSFGIWKLVLNILESI